MEIKTLILILLASLTNAVHAADVLIRSVAVVSPQLTVPMLNTDVLIRNGRIESLLPASQDEPSDIELIDGQGLFLTPGLMDSHVHTVLVPGFPMSTERLSAGAQKLSLLYRRQQPRSYLYHGVTQLVDLAASPSLLEPFESAAVRPHTLHCGAAPLVNGYPTMFSQDSSLDTLFPYYVVEDAADGTRHPEADDHSPERVVERIHAAGAVCVKLFFEDGFGELSSWPMLSDDSVHRIIETARDKQLKVVVHANALDMQTRALQFDVDVIAHGLWNWNQYRRDSVMPEPIRKHLDDLHTRGIQFQPTIGVMSGLRSLFDEKLLTDSRLADVVPQELLGWYATPDGGWFREELIRDEGWEGKSNSAIMSGFDSGVDKGSQAIDYLSKLSHPLLLASDTPSSPTYGNQPGLNTLLEIQSMHAAGLSLIEVFRAATINNAVAFGVDQDYGTVEKGKVANLLLLESDPLTTIDAYDSIRHVIVDGSTYDRSAFSARRLK